MLMWLERNSLAMRLNQWQGKHTNTAQQNAFRWYWTYALT